VFQFLLERSPVLFVKTAFLIGLLPEQPFDGVRIELAEGR
jgi:hypothetical protein